MPAVVYRAPASGDELDCLGVSERGMRIVEEIGILKKGDPVVVEEELDKGSIFDLPEGCKQAPEYGRGLFEVRPQYVQVLSDPLSERQGFYCGNILFEGQHDASMNWEPVYGNSDFQLD